jgi:carbon starvation protein
VSVGHVNAFASGLAGMASSLGIPVEHGETFIALAISAFMLTTLDTATRLTRFTWQELFLPRKGSAAPIPAIGQVLSHRMVASAVAVVIAGVMALSGTAGQIWPVFGASNQLLAALALMVVAVYLWQRKKAWWLAGVPAVFMMVVCVWALFALLHDQFAPLLSALHAKQGILEALHTTPWALVGVALFLLVLALVLTWRTVGGGLLSQSENYKEVNDGS